MSQDFHRDLLKWYKQNKRDLPWRNTKNPYFIWLSEIMLQQTRVETVLPYYDKFIKEYPRIEKLAKAPQDELNANWAGLGYYSRARNLKNTAEIIVKTYGGKFPPAKDELKKLPGIGEYTASAIASIAFNQNSAAIDGNLERVIARVCLIHDELKSKAANQKISAFMNSLLQWKNAGDLNQAFMDLSSAICLPKIPRCHQCPIQEYCLAFKNGVASDLPQKKPKPQFIQKQAFGIVLLFNKNSPKVLLTKRKENLWLAGMWDLPWQLDNDFHWKNTINSIDHTIIKRTITKHKIQTQFQLLVSSQKTVPEQLHAIGSEFRWVSLDSQQELPKPSMKALEWARKHFKN